MNRAQLSVHPKISNSGPLSAQLRSTCACVLRPIRPSQVDLRSSCLQPSPDLDWWSACRRPRCGSSRAVASSALRTRDTHGRSASAATRLPAARIPRTSRSRFCFDRRRWRARLPACRGCCWGLCLRDSSAAWSYQSLHDDLIRLPEEPMIASNWPGFTVPF